jgi:2-amino-4-hydroxy-6-hydroxymethyldihydropteridine diphosphokinase
MTDNLAYLSLGSNSNPIDNLQACVKLLDNYCDVLGISSIYQTKPVGEITDNQPDYFNAAIVVRTTLDAISLKENVLTRIESKLGRARGDKASSLIPIDIDIVLFNTDQFQVGNRQIPEPKIYEYAFIAIPLADIAPDYIHPVTGDKISEIASKFKGTREVKVRRDVSLSN